MENYSKKFQLLLHLEEHQLSMDIRRYNMENVCMSRDPSNTELLVLEVNTLSIYTAVPLTDPDWNPVCYLDE